MLSRSFCVNIYDYLAGNIINNVLRVISVDNNITFNVVVRRYRVLKVRDEEFLYGYEDNDKGEDLEYDEWGCKALILFKPDLRFLESIGFSYESDNGVGSELPIIAVFSVDNILKDDNVGVKLSYRKNNKKFEEEKWFVVSDMRSYVYGSNYLNFYKLVVKR